MAQLTIQQAFGLALQHQRAGRLAQAEQLYQQILASQPNHSGALHALGVLSGQMGRSDVAADLLARAVALCPHDASLRGNLGNALTAAGRLDEAIATYQQALALKPDHAETWCNLGNALKDKGQMNEALAAWRRAIALKPGLAAAYCNLGNGLLDQGQVDQARAACRQAISLQPALAEAHSTLGNALLHRGQVDEALVAYRQALAVRADSARIHSNLLYALHFHPASDPQSIHREHALWNQLHAKPFTPLIQPHTNPRQPDKRLSIGYLSPDFREHPVGRFLLPLLGAHDHRQFEIFCYADQNRDDALTQRLRAHADVWQVVYGITDQGLADRIRHDGIDILVDLSMHMANGRPLVFARKPAPVQVTYLAYCSTTGLDAIDYRLTDPLLDPPGMDDSYYSEQSIRLPETYWCYDPGIATPPVNDLPAIGSGRLTFGCLNNFCKVTQPTLETWAVLLKSVAGSRLVLNCPSDSSRQGVLAFFGSRDIDPARIAFAGGVRLVQYFQLYHQIDIALDPFPYGGGTTTCDLLWMGVPVVSLAGKLAISRSGLTLLSNVGLSHLAVTSPQSYVEAAVNLARDLPALQQLRCSLRPRMQQSALMDAGRFASHVEAAYRGMWQRWCAGRARC